MAKKNTILTRQTPAMTVPPPIRQKCDKSQKQRIRFGVFGIASIQPFAKTVTNHKNGECETVQAKADFGL